MFYPKLFENPNSIYLEKLDVNVNWYDVKTLGFSYYNDEMHVSSQSHYAMYKDLKINDPVAKSREGRGRYAGRLFLSSKIITFWEFPETNDILTMVLYDIEQLTSIKFDETWKIEVPVKYKGYDYTINGWGKYYPRKNEQHYVTIDDYDGNFARKPQEIMQKHVMPPIEKQKLKNNSYPRGFGSDKTSWDSQRNIAIRQKELTSESKK